jgi:FMN-dependent NADH-azoreductase
MPPSTIFFGGNVGTILQLSASIHSIEGHSSRLADEFAAKLLERNPRAQRIVRDLATDPVPHLDAERFKAFVTRESERTEKERSLVAYSDSLIDELRRADVIVLGLPMYNFGVPSQLKAWFDHIARAGVTFRYTANGPVGLLTGKKAVVLAARGEVRGNARRYADAVRAPFPRLSRHHGRGVRVR